MSQHILKKVYFKCYRGGLSIIVIIFFFFCITLSFFVSFSLANKLVLFFLEVPYKRKQICFKLKKDFHLCFFTIEQIIFASNYTLETINNLLGYLSEMQFTPAVTYYYSYLLKDEMSAASLTYILIFCCFFLTVVFFFICFHTSFDTLQVFFNKMLSIILSGSPKIIILSGITLECLFTF